MFRYFYCCIYVPFLSIMGRQLAFCKQFANELLSMSEYGTGLADTTRSATLNRDRHDRIGPLSLTRKTPNFKGEGNKVFSVEEYYFQ